mmetsp:Transcript_155000/g.269875  ORF Transcript_155000/g.269875 Transcript_155000/m.269875 type:complete len:122 (+) Transcript_155000:596-961(+)
MASNPQQELARDKEVHNPNLDACILTPDSTPRGTARSTLLGQHTSTDCTAHATALVSTANTYAHFNRDCQGVLNQLWPTMLVQTIRQHIQANRSGHCSIGARFLREPQIYSNKHFFPQCTG